MAPMWYVLSGDSLQVPVGGNHLILHGPFILPRRHVNLTNPVGTTLALEEFHLQTSCLCAADTGFALFDSSPKTNKKHLHVYFLPLYPPWQPCFAESQTVALANLTTKRRRHAKRPTYLPKPSKVFIEIDITLHPAGPSYRVTPNKH